MDRGGACRCRDRRILLAGMRGSRPTRRTSPESSSSSAAEPAARTLAARMLVCLLSHSLIAVELASSQLAARVRDSMFYTPTTPVRDQGHCGSAGYSRRLVVLRALGSCPLAFSCTSLSSSWLIALSRALAATVVLWTPLAHPTCKICFKEVSFTEAQLNAEILSSAHVVLITPLAVLELMFTTLTFSMSLRPC